MSRLPKAFRSAFTLIELLIVVAIIAILAAIAVPNFLEAQTRSKVSRCKADIRTLATAIESYIVDHTHGPSDRGNNKPGRPYDIWDNGKVDYSTEPKANYTIGFELTTPIAYLTSAAAMKDPFKLQKYTGQYTGREYYCFGNANYRKKNTIPPAVLSTIVLNAFDRCGSWYIMGAGPDQWVNNLPGTTTDFSSGNEIPRGVNYDPSNGTISNGDIYRCQKQSDGMRELGLGPGV